MVNWAIVKFAETCLRTSGIPVPTNEQKIREKAYKLLLEDNPFTAISIKLGKDFNKFNREDWSEALKAPGVIGAVINNKRALALCRAYGFKLGAS
jgi:hypothetical protein